jgi:hypothetical protein
MKSLTYWITKHPAQTVFYLLYFVTLAVLTGFDMIPYYACAIGYAGALSYWGVGAHKEMKKIISIVLSVLIVGHLMQPRKTEAAGGVAVGVVVVVVGGVAVIYLVKTCRRLFDKPPKTNEAELVHFNLGESSSGDDYAASWNYSSYGSCYVPPEFRAASIPATETVISLSGELRIGDLGPEMVLIPNQASAGDVIGLQEFNRLIAEHGVPGINGQIGAQYFAKNGQPVSQDQVPIFFDSVNHGVSTATSYDNYNMAIERSFDLETWERVAVINLSVGNQIKINDSTIASQAFYRAKAL